jgi:polar amino acid transport system substrate-binding protein
MRRHLKKLIILYSAIAIVWCMAFGVSAKGTPETITIAADPWCPYTCNLEAGRQGLMIDVATKAFAAHNITVKYVIIPWTRAITDARAGHFTAIAGAATSDAPDFVFPNTPLWRIQNTFYVKKDSTWRYQGTESLSNVAMGVISDYSYSDIVDAYVKQYKDDFAKIQVVGGDNALGINVKKLLAGHIDVLVEDHLVMAYYLSEHKLGSIKEAGKVPPSEQDKIYIAFSPKNPNAKRYAAILDAEIAKMQKNGELASILKTYVLNE